MKILKICIFALLPFTICSFLLSKTATLKVYSALIDYEVFFQDEDVSILSYNLIDPGILSNEVKVSGSMTIDGVYTTFTGQFTSPYSTKDNNSNGVYDFFEVGENFSMDLTGSASYSLQGYGNFSANLYANVQRIYGQHAFTLNETVTIQSSNIEGIYAGQTGSISEKLNAVHALGTIAYDENAGTYSYYLGYHGTTGSASGSGTYIVNSDSSISLSEMSFPSVADSSLSSSFPALAKKTLSSSITVPFTSGTRFHVMIQIENVPYYLVIEDDNDANSDGKPDLLRTISQQVPEVNLSGWNYHIWPWAYNSLEENWLYYYRSGDDWLVWRNKTSTWLKFDANNGLWVSN
jgi:hypothetical protein